MDNGRANSCESPATLTRRARRAIDGARMTSERATPSHAAATLGPAPTTCSYRYSHVMTNRMWVWARCLFHIPISNCLLLMSLANAALRTQEFARQSARRQHLAQSLVGLGRLTSEKNFKQALAKLPQSSGIPRLLATSIPQEARPGSGYRRDMLKKPITRREPTCHAQLLFGPATSNVVRQYKIAIISTPASPTSNSGPARHRRRPRRERR